MAPLLLSGYGVAQAASPSPAPSAGGGSSNAASSTASKVPVVTFGVEPYTPAVHGQTQSARPFFGYDVTPGGHVTDYAAVLNYSYQWLSLQVAAADAVNTSTGGFALLPVTAKQTQVGAWVTIPASKRTVAVPPRSGINGRDIGTVIVPFNVVIPQNAQPGDHFGGIVVTLRSSIKDKSGQLFHLDQRVGSRVFIRVSGPLRPQLTIQALQASYHGTANPIGTGTATVTYVVHNTGNVGMGGQQTVTIKGLFGATATAKKLPPIPLLLPGGFDVIQVKVPGVFPEFLMKAHVAVTPLYIAGTAQPKSGPFTAGTSFWAIPWALIAIVVLLAAGIAGYIWRRRVRRNQPPAADDEDDLVEPDIDLADGSELVAPGIPAARSASTRSRMTTAKIPRAVSDDVILPSAKRSANGSATASTKPARKSAAKSATARSAAAKSTTTRSATDKSATANKKAAVQPAEPREATGESP
jgi:hypothetical protein